MTNTEMRMGTRVEITNFSKMPESGSDPSSKKRIDKPSTVIKTDQGIDTLGLISHLRIMSKKKERKKTKKII